MAQERTVVIDGFAFHSRKEAIKAQKELEGVNYLKERMQGQDPQKVLEFYHKMLDEEVFETPIGLTFEKEIMERLKETEGIDPELVRPVDVKLLAPPVQEKKNDEHINEKNKKKDRVPFVSVVLNVVLLILVVGMFFLAKTSNNVNIINYENALVDKYENWQMQLEEKETELAEREAALGK